MNLYFETSALAKLIVTEEGSDVAADLWNASDFIVTNRITYPETRAAIAAARRARRLSDGELRDAKLALEARFQAMGMLELTPRIARAAGELAEQFGLRGYDAVHLASTISFGAEELVLATWDRDLARAGRFLGLGLAGVTL